MKTEGPSRRSRAAALPLRIVVLNRQRAVAIPRAKISAVLQGAARDLLVSGELSILFTRDEEMRRLNRSFRRKDKPTDVLSFEGPGGEMGLGDVAISVDTAARNARAGGRTLPEELQVLALHGFLHALGHDHETDSGEMEMLERRLRRALIGSRGGRPAKRRAA